MIDQLLDDELAPGTNELKPQSFWTDEKGGEIKTRQVKGAAD